MSLTVALAFLIGVQAAIIACGYAAIRSLLKQLATKESLIRAPALVARRVTGRGQHSHSRRQ